MAYPFVVTTTGINIAPGGIHSGVIVVPVGVRKCRNVYFDVGLSGVTYDIKVQSQKTSMVHLDGFRNNSCGIIGSIPLNIESNNLADDRFLITLTNRGAANADLTLSMYFEQ